jgi:hypothetical protein
MVEIGPIVSNLCIFMHGILISVSYVVPATHTVLRQRPQASVGPTTMYQGCQPQPGIPPTSVLTSDNVLQPRATKTTAVQTTNVLPPSSSISDSDFSPHTSTQQIIPSEDPQ